MILTYYGPLATTLIPLLEKYGHEYVVLCPTLLEALESQNRRLRTFFGVVRNRWGASFCAAESASTMP